MPTRSDKSDPRFIAAIAAIDEANDIDPNQVLVDGCSRPAERVYSERMTAVLARLHPDADDLLKIAARAQHIQRWAVPRARYPMDRTGYLRWRNELKARHAELTGDIMRRCGYGDAEVERVKALIRKQNLKRDPDAQALEDVACLVFLEHYFPQFAEKHDDEKLIGIIRKTWNKMSARARAEALRLPLPNHLQVIFEQALSNPWVPRHVSGRAEPSS